jgi:hypothetical protein
MKRKLFSAVFFLTAISVWLGAFGHGSQWSKHVLPAVTGVDAQMIKLLALIWHWVSGTMLVFGVLLIWTWWRLGRGDRNLLFIPWTIGIFYFVEGLYGAMHLGSFFLLFVAQAVLLCASAWGIGAPTVAPTQIRAAR